FSLSLALRARARESFRHPGNVFELCVKSRGRQREPGRRDSFSGRPATVFSSPESEEEMMPRIAAVLIALGLLSVGPTIRLSAQSLRVPYETFTLPNGLQVILHEDHSVPVVAVNTWFHVGSADEQPGRTGFAQRVEHMVFLGARDVTTGRP